MDTNVKIDVNLQEKLKKIIAEGNNTVSATKSVNEAMNCTKQGCWSSWA